MGSQDLPDAAQAAGGTSGHLQQHPAQVRHAQQVPGQQLPPEPRFPMECHTQRLANPTGGIPIPLRATMTLMCINSICQHAKWQYDQPATDSNSCMYFKNDVR